MSMRIPPSPLPIPSQAMSRAQFGEGGSPRFGNLVREFESGSAGPTDFLGQQQSAGSSANLFNADGFFTKLEQRLAGQPTEQPSAAATAPDSPPLLPDAGGALRPVAISPAPRSDHVAAVSQKLMRHVPDAPSRPELPPQAAEQARLHRPPAAPTTAGEIQEVGDERPDKPERAHEPPVRLDLGSTPFRAFIDGGSVRIIGPARYLSEAEEEALAAAVAELMTTHDLGVEDLWFNGRRMMPGQSGAG